jgi:hypothetical protein
MKTLFNFKIPFNDNKGWCNNTSVLCFAVTFFLLFLVGCKKYITVNELKDQLLDEQVFNDAASANAAILGIYRSPKESAQSLTINGEASLLSNDVTYFQTAQIILDFQNYTVTSDSPFTPWPSLYTMIYRANKAIEGLDNSTKIPEIKRLQFLGEAKFLRAYAYFYLVNFFGDVPALTTTNVAVTSVAKRDPKDQVYALIISDLLFAQANLATDYSISAGARTRANKWAATALLARTYLYTKDWDKAEVQANNLINSGPYALLTVGGAIFSKDNTEAILQWDRYSAEPFSLPGYFIWTNPVMACSNSLLNAFETGDKRKTSWILSKVVSGTTYYYPNKFTSTATTGFTEYETPLRLAEQYLIRAESRAMKNDFAGAISDINVVRSKHGGLLTGLPTPSTQSACLDIVMRERQVDYFAEASHRWFDLKRTDKINTALQAEKPTVWKTTAAFLPIPTSEMQLNPNMTQNPGYQ